MAEAINSEDYHDYVIKDGRFIGAFEQMYRKIDDPWNVGDASVIQYDMALYLLNRYEICRKGSLLDIGCGKGAFTARLKHMLPGADILAVDISPTAIKKARREYGGLGIDFQVMDIQKEYTAIKNKYDLIVMAGIMWYILPDFQAIVKHLGSKVISDDGHLLITNQPLYKPDDQKYGKEIISTIEDMLGLIDLEIVEMLELNRLSNYTVTLLLKKPEKKA